MCWGDLELYYIFFIIDNWLGSHLDRRGIAVTKQNLLGKAAKLTVNGVLTLMLLQGF